MENLTMASKRASVYIPEHLAPILDLKPEGSEGGLSNRLAAIVDRYGALVRSCPLPLSRAEWGLVLDVCNGWGMWAEAALTLHAGLALEVVDGCRLNDLHTKWGLSAAQAKQLVDKLNAFSLLQTVAVIERVERFWRRTDLDLTAALQAAGIEPIE